MFTNLIAGIPVLRHVKNIAAGKTKSLLTLPRKVIENIARRLTFQDIVTLIGLSSISNEVLTKSIKRLQSMNDNLTFNRKSLFLDNM